MRKLLAFALIICMMLTGCSLAVEEAQVDGMVNGDRLVGVVVTTEHLGLFDMERYLADHPDALKGGEIDPTGYEGRIYAQEVREQSSTEDGVPVTTVYYNFDHVEGIALLFYNARTILEDGTLHSDFYTGNCGEGFRDVTFGSGYTEGTIFVPMDGGEVSFFLNPVYQDGDGQLYMIPGTGISSQSNLGSMWQNIKEEFTQTVGEETQTITQEFKVIIKWVELSKSVTIYQMDGAHQILTENTYTPEAVPDDITPAEGCSYILVEELRDDGIARTLLQPGGEGVTIYRPLVGEIYCTGTHIDVLWPEE